MADKLYPRHLRQRVLAALADTPVVLVHGARQVGKSTLVRDLLAEDHPSTYFTLDDATVQAAAASDPVGFLAQAAGPLVLDEVQKAPELFVALKGEVDRDRRPGRFLLTGSANALMIPGLARELVGRMEILTLWPLSQGEIGRKRERFTELVFSEAASEWSRDTAGTLDIWERSLRGGYPEALTRDSGDRRNAWYRSYISTVVQREVRDMANIEGLSQLPRLLALLAARVGGLLNVAEISNAIDIPQTTLKRYLALLEATHLVKLVPAWSGNVGKRLMKSPKLYLVDTGLLAHLLGMDIERLRTDHPVRGAFLENFVVIEVLKQFGWGSERVEVFHFRTSAGLEVDFILEDSRGNCVCLEVKSSHTVRSEDFRGMKTFASLVGSRFQAGVVLYAGSEVVPFGEGFHAVPLAALWEASA